MVSDTAAAKGFTLAFRARIIGAIAVILIVFYLGYRFARRCDDDDEETEKMRGASTCYHDEDCPSGSYCAKPGYCVPNEAKAVSSNLYGKNVDLGRGRQFEEDRFRRPT